MTTSHDSKLTWKPVYRLFERMAIIASLSLLYALKKCGKSLGLATPCGGGGVSMSTVIEIL